MQKVRVYQLAKELKVQSALILELLDRIGAEVRSDLSVLDLNTADLVRQKVTLALETEKRRILAEREAEAQIEAESVIEDVAETEVAEPVAAPPDEERVPLAAEPAEPAPPPSPATPPQAPPAAPQQPPSRVEAPAARTEVPAAATPLTPAAPGVNKPRVFPARRIPTAAMLAKAKAARAGTAVARGVTPPGRPGMPPRPGTMPPKPGRPMGPGAKKRRKKDRAAAAKAAPPVPTRPKPDLPPVPEEITLSEGATVKELAEKLNRKSKDVIARLLGRGVLATINQPLEPDVAIAVADEFGSKAKVITFEEEAQSPITFEDVAQDEAADPAEPEPRPPVVTVMGHVDHGKTSLLDAMRQTNVVDREAGGITQHIGAYQVRTNGRGITFLDTPGHEAFTMMRARGARATDIVVLVVAADDGVKPQTKEAIDHAKAAGVPIVVAINKIDKPNANPDRVKQQLTEEELVVEEYGGDVVSCEVSAKKRTGLEQLLEMILLVADMKELKATPGRLAAGTVLEARLDRSRGILCTILVQNGTLKVGDAFIAGTAYGKVRAMTDETGSKVTEAGPSTPVEVMGYASEPMAGDSFQAVKDEAKARQIASFRSEKVRAEKQKASARTTLEAFSQQISAGAVKELPLILKGDVHGSLEALGKALGELPSGKVKVNVLRSSIGAINQADVLLASASNALIIGFNVRPDRPAADLAKREKVEVRLYTVIYDLLDDVKRAMLGMLEPTVRETVTGQADVRQPFKIPKIGVIAGCYVTDGTVTRNADVRLLRDNVVVFTGKIGSLRRFKEDIGEVKSGYECGIGIANYNDIKPGDVLEFFVTEKVAQKAL